MADSGPELILTSDGSHSLRSPLFGESYHSLHGAVQESSHVYIRAGLAYAHERYSGASELSILELGFGTGLNALLSLLYAFEQGLSIHYAAIEAYPIDAELAARLNYALVLSLTEAESALFMEMHRLPWGKVGRLSTGRMGRVANMSLEKRHGFFEELSDEEAYELVYYDAFAPSVQPDCWNMEMVKKVRRALRPGGVLTTFSAQGAFRRRLQAAGFEVERLPGPPGKREMLRATLPF